MKIQNKVLTVFLTVMLATTSANAFVPLLVFAGNLVVAEVSSVAVVAEAVAMGETATAIGAVAQSGGAIATRGVVTNMIKGSSNYRRTALNNTQTKQGGWIKDPYNGKHYRSKDMDVDHIWPQSKGGPNHSWNLVMASKQTNRSKSDNIDSRVIQGYYENTKQGFQNLMR